MRGHPATDQQVEWATYRHWNLTILDKAGTRWEQESLVAGWAAQMASDLKDLVKALDIDVFRVPTETSLADRQSLLRLQNVVATGFPGYRYLEIGSHLGGSIFPHLADSRCAEIVSIDLRPASQPDERGQTFDYHENSSARMIGLLSDTAGSDASTKVRMIDRDAADVGPEEVGRGIRYVLIDAEHTNRAAFRDFTRALRMIEPAGMVAFHDANLLVDALANIEELLWFVGRPHRGFFLPDVVYAVAFGDMIELADAALVPRVIRIGGRVV